MRILGPSGWRTMHSPECSCRSAACAGPEPGRAQDALLQQRSARQRFEYAQRRTLGILQRLDRHVERLLQHVAARQHRSEEHTSELQSLMRISYAVFCLKKKKFKYNLHILF